MELLWEGGLAIEPSNEQKFEHHSEECNKLLTRSFKLLMGHPVDGASFHGYDRKRPSNSKALSLAIDTLEILRRVSQQAFLSSTRHQRNPSTLKARSLGQDKPKISPKTYNNGLPAPVPWKGVPYGVMLRVNGLEIARSCAHIRRFASALFYVDLHLNAQLGSVGGILEKESI